MRVNCPRIRKFIVCDTYTSIERFDLEFGSHFRGKNGRYLKILEFLREETKYIAENCQALLNRRYRLTERGILKYKLLLTQI